MIRLRPQLQEYQSRIYREGQENFLLDNGFGVSVIGHRRRHDVTDHYMIGCNGNNRFVNIVLSTTMLLRSGPDSYRQVQ